MIVVMFISEDEYPFIWIYIPGFPGPISAFGVSYYD